MTEIVESLKNELSSIPFFSRVFLNKKKDIIIVWNDIDIVKQYKLDSSIDINQIMKDIKQKIEEKYKIENNIVSVIIPNYNNEYFIKEVIERILKSTYKNIEIIIVDDKSTDDSVKIIQDNFKNEIESKKIRLFINTENNGTYYCRNKGILLSKGSFIFFVDGDDYIEPKLIERMYNWLSNPNNREYWAYQRPFSRIYMNENYEEIERVKTPYYVTIFRRKLYNYIGYYQDNRFGADTELIKRLIYNEYLCFKDYKIKTNEYFANTVVNKNLTSIINREERIKYLIKAKDNIKKKKYIRMALLENLENLFTIVQS
jgi:glycosyltransferase involved in cell wall biosynthesis